MNPDTSYPKGKVTGHFLMHWGVPHEMHIQQGVPFEPAIIEWHPSRWSGIYHFATNGMGAYLQSEAGKECLTRTELFACASAPHPWIIKVLTQLAGYPLQYHVLFNEFDTIPVADAMDGKTSPFRGLLLLPPMPPEPKTLGAILDIAPEPVLVHQVVGIYESERQFAIEHGSEALLEKLRVAQASFLIDGLRERVA